MSRRGASAASDRRVARWPPTRHRRRPRWQAPDRPRCGYRLHRSVWWRASGSAPRAACRDRARRRRRLARAVITITRRGQSSGASQQPASSSRWPSRRSSESKPLRPSAKQPCSARARSQRLAAEHGHHALRCGADALTRCIGRRRIGKAGVEPQLDVGHRLQHGAHDVELRPHRPSTHRDRPHTAAENRNDGTVRAPARPGRCRDTGSRPSVDRIGGHRAGRARPGHASGSMTGTRSMRVREIGG